MRSAYRCMMGEAKVACTHYVSTHPLVGFPVREYSYPSPNELGSSRPVGTPGLRCTKVVARDMGSTTAPVGLDVPLLVP